jgi:hypothetical protein
LKIKNAGRRIAGELRGRPSRLFDGFFAAASPPIDAARHVSTANLRMIANPANPEIICPFYFFIHEFQEFF